MKPIARVLGLVAAGLIAGWASPAAAGHLCTIVADAGSGEILVEKGSGCGDRVTPASTFKIALAVMGYDAGILADAGNPVLPFRTGYPDWGGDAWRRPVGPADWMKHSVVWFSQRITERLGTERLTGYARAFGYGNADLSGDPGRNNGLERAWIASSLRISPREQAAFLGRLATSRLPVAASAIAGTKAIVERSDRSGWAIQGKTGTAYPRRADGSFDRARAWGWYVGWAQRDGRVVAFAYLQQDEKRNPVSGGLRARDALLDAWAGLAASLPVR